MKIWIMNRDSGISEEKVELVSPGSKWEVKDLMQTNWYSNGEKRILKINDWDPVLYQRGCHDIVDQFIACVENRKSPFPSTRDSLITHELCEKIVGKLQAM